MSDRLSEMDVRNSIPILGLERLSREGGYFRDT